MVLEPVQSTISTNPNQEASPMANAASAAPVQGQRPVPLADALPSAVMEALRTMRNDQVVSLAIPGSKRRGDRVAVILHDVAMYWDVDPKDLAAAILQGLTRAP